jgi:hypothetical protein
LAFLSAKRKKQFFSAQLWPKLSCKFQGKPLFLKTVEQAKAAEV